MKEHLHSLIFSSLEKINNDNINNVLENINIVIEHTRDKKFGDFASNIAMVLSKKIGMNPREFAAIIIENLPKSSKIIKIEIAGPGFINFYLADNALNSIIEEILKQKDAFGTNTSGAEKKIHMEFVSANPTGPLHVGHGRSAAFGSALANILRANGVHLHTEYYVNDAGRQMDILATSVFLRYLELNDVDFPFPSNGYKGEYVYDIAKALLTTYQNKFTVNTQDIFQNVLADLTEQNPEGDKEGHIDGLIANTKTVFKEKKDSNQYSQHQWKFSL